MALLGQGIIPSGAVGNEIVAVTRRAFIPKLVVQLYKATPTMSAFLAAAEPITGGASPVTQPVQGAAMVTTQTTDYSGAFSSPAVQVGIQNAEFDLKAYVTPIPYYTMEGLVQDGAAVIPLLEARMNDAGNSIADTLATDLNTANASNLATWSIPDVINTANPSRANYGGIDRSSNSFWKGNLIDGTAVTPTRATVLKWITSATKASGGEKPDFGVMGPSEWLQLAEDFVGQERYLVTPEGAYGANGKQVNAAFTALSVAGVPIYMDLYINPDGTSGSGVLNLFNTKYLGYKIHADAAFAVDGPQSLLANGQLGSVMVLLVLLEFVCSKPAAQTRVINLVTAGTI